MVYADTSFFVSLYINDIHSTAADALLRSGFRPSFTPLHFAELMHAAAQHVFRGQMTPKELRGVVERVESDLKSQVWPTAAVPEKAFEQCAELARVHGPKLGIRTLDSLHIACAVELRAERFWTFDERQAKLAKAEGLRTA